MITFIINWLLPIILFIGIIVICIRLGKIIDILDELAENIVSIINIKNNKNNE